MTREMVEHEDSDLFATIGEQVTSLKLGDSDVADEDGEGALVKIVDEIESLCMNCHENGTTRLLLTQIPHFREVVLSSFYCDHCNFKNNGVQPAGEIQEKGSSYLFKIETLEDLQRGILKSDTGILEIPDLELTAPAGAGRLTNIEGLLNGILEDFEDGQKQRKEIDPDTYEQIDKKVVQPLLQLLSQPETHPCTILLDDPTGNSWVEPSPKDQLGKAKWTHIMYARSPQQNEELGLTATDAEDSRDGMEGVGILEGAALDMHVDCPGCAKLAHLVHQPVNIPYFKEVILSSTRCDNCGYQTNDVMSGGKVSAKGKLITLKAEGPRDLHREILKSRSCHLEIPELELDMQPGTMGGKFTTVEGVLTQMRDDLKGTVYDVGDETAPSDSMPATTKQMWRDFFARIEKAIAGEIPYTLMMHDPLADSYCQPFIPSGLAIDPQIQTEDYVRSAEEDDDLGLKDMKTKLNEDGEYVKDTFDENTGELQEISETGKESHQVLGEDPK